jgi:hypothetical protein
MITKEEILCGSRDELIEYFHNNFKFSDIVNPFGVIYYFMPEFGSIETQVDRIKNSGVIFFNKAYKNQDYSIDDVIIQKFWVFVRTPKTNDADASH